MLTLNYPTDDKAEIEKWLNGEDGTVNIDEINAIFAVQFGQTDRDLTSQEMKSKMRLTQFKRYLSQFIPAKLEDKLDLYNPNPDSRT